MPLDVIVSGPEETAFSYISDPNSHTVIAGGRPSELEAQRLRVEMLTVLNQSLLLRSPSLDPSPDNLIQTIKGRTPRSWELPTQPQSTPYQGRAIVPDTSYGRIQYALPAPDHSTAVRVTVGRGEDVSDRFGLDMSATGEVHDTTVGRRQCTFLVTHDNNMLSLLVTHETGSNETLVCVGGIPTVVPKDKYLFAPPGSIVSIGLDTAYRVTEIPGPQGDTIGLVLIDRRDARLVRDMYTVIKSPKSGSIHGTEAERAELRAREYNAYVDTVLGMLAGTVQVNLLDANRQPVNPTALFEDVCRHPRPARVLQRTSDLGPVQAVPQGVTWLDAIHDAPLNREALQASQVPTEIAAQLTGIAQHQESVPSPQPTAVPEVIQLPAEVIRPRLHPEHWNEASVIRAISDTHGFPLEQFLVGLVEGEHIVIAGDVIDRGHDNVGDMNKVVDLVEQGRATLLVGNHDLFLLSGFLGGEIIQIKYWLDNGGEDVLTELGISIPPSGDSLQRAQTVINAFRSSDSRWQPLRRYIDCLQRNGRTFIVANHQLITHAGVLIEQSGALRSEFVPGRKDLGRLSGLDLLLAWENEIRNPNSKALGAMGNAAEEMNPLFDRDLFWLRGDPAVMSTVRHQLKEAAKKFFGSEVYVHAISAGHNRLSRGISAGGISNSGTLTYAMLDGGAAYEDGVGALYQRIARSETTLTFTTIHAPTNRVLGLQQQSDARGTKSLGT